MEDLSFFDCAIIKSHTLFFHTVLCSYSGFTHEWNQFRTVREREKQLAGVCSRCYGDCESIFKKNHSFHPHHHHKHPSLYTVRGHVALWIRYFTHIIELLSRLYRFPQYVFLYCKAHGKLQILHIHLENLQGASWIWNHDPLLEKA